MQNIIITIPHLGLRSMYLINQQIPENERGWLAATDFVDSEVVDEIDAGTANSCTIGKIGQAGGWFVR